jgi:hypothetical protein
MSELNEKLVADLARLVVRYPAEDWEHLANWLADDRLRDSLRTLLEELATASRASGKTKKNTAATNRTKRLREAISRLRLTDPARANEIELLWEKLRSRELLPTMPSVKAFAAAIGLKGLESTKREGAILELLHHLAAMPSGEAERLMANTVVEDRHLGAEYERWTQLIMGQRDASGGGRAKKETAALPSPRPEEKIGPSEDSVDRVIEVDGRTAIVLPCTDEPFETKRSLNEASPDVREATLRQASDIATSVYRAWKADLNPVGVTWQVFQSAASANHAAWRRWLSGELTWRGSLDALVERLNEKASPPALVLAK